MNTEYGGFQFINICTFQIQNFEMALKSTSLIEDIEMWYLKTLERLKKNSNLEEFKLAQCWIQGD